MKYSLLSIVILLSFSLHQATTNSAFSQRMSSTKRGNTSSDWNETVLKMTLGTQRVVYDNRVDVRFDERQEPVLIYAFEKDGSYLQALNNYWTPDQKPIHLPGIYFMDFEIVDGNYYVLAKELAGYKGDGVLESEKEGHVLIFLKVTPQGKVIYKQKLLGHEGTAGGQYFLCTMSGNGELKYDGTYFHAFVETCGNFSSRGSSAFDIHEGDYYLTFDKQGTVRHNGRREWLHSHSGLLQMVTDRAGEAFTVSVGDAHPYGVSFNHFSDGEMKQDVVLFPDQSKLPYDDMYAASVSSTEAGIIGGLVQIGDYFYTIVATVPSEKHPTLNQAKDLLFLKFDRSGNILMQRWIEKTPNVNETVPHIIAYGDKIFLASMVQTGEYDYDYKATVAVLNTQGQYTVQPQKTNHYLDYQSRLVNFPNGDVGLVTTESYAKEFAIVRFGKGKMPSKANPSDAASMTPQGTAGNSSVSTQMPTIEKFGTCDIDLTKAVDKNLQFDGSYTIQSTPDATNGIYVTGEYSYTPDFSLYLKKLDHSNFTVEAEFMVTEYRNAAVFSMSQSNRYVEYILTKEGRVSLKLMNGKTLASSDVKYNLNTWHKAKVVVDGTRVSFYLDGRLVLTETAYIAGDKPIRTADFSTTSFGNAWVFKGYMRRFSVGQAQ